MSTVEPVSLAEPVDITYEMLAHRVNRFARALTHAGLGAGHGVATLMGRVPELYVTALGTLKAGGVYSPQGRRHPRPAPRPAADRHRRCS